MYYKRNGEPYPSGREGLIAFSEDFEKMDRHVGLKMLPNGIEISTVWLGIDHNFGMRQRPLIFESMAFFNGKDIDCIRYSTEEEARLGHKMLIKKWSIFKTAEEILKV